VLVVYGSFERVVLTSWGPKSVVHILNQEDSREPNSA
jgi:hypothetical protein